MRELFRLKYVLNRTFLGHKVRNGLQWLGSCRTLTSAERYVIFADAFTLIFGGSTLLIVFQALTGVNLEAPKHTIPVVVVLPSRQL